MFDKIIVAIYSEILSVHIVTHSRAPTASFSLHSPTLLSADVAFLDVDTAFRAEAQCEVFPATVGNENQDGRDSVKRPRVGGGQQL